MMSVASEPGHRLDGEPHKYAHEVTTFAGDVPAALPRGPHKLSREEVQERQRQRLLYATTMVAARRGYAKTAVADIIAEAGVSRATFYELFSSREECFQAAYRQIAELVAALMSNELEQVREDEREPLGRLDRVLGVYLRLLHDNPELARIFLVEVYVAGPDLIEQRRASLERFVDIVAETHRGETGLLGTEPDQRFAAQALVGAVSSLVTNCVGSGDIEGLLDLREPLMRLAAQITGKS
jgi:AcrR family transcriptional regulator